MCQKQTSIDHFSYLLYSKIFKFNFKLNCGYYETTQFSTVTPGTTIFVYVTAQEISSVTPKTTHSTSTSYDTTKIKTVKPTTQSRASKTSDSTTKYQTSKIRTNPTSPKYTTAITTKQIPYKKFHCPEPSGIFPNLHDCKRFWHCSNNMAYDKGCPGNLYFDRKLKTCSWSSDSCMQNFVYSENSGVTKPPYTQPSNGNLIIKNVI